MFAAVTFARAPSTALISLSLTGKPLSMSAGRILDRLTGLPQDDKQKEKENLKERGYGKRMTRGKFPKQLNAITPTKVGTWPLVGGHDLG